jgi:predicted PurR-regulated permease PerM
LKRSAKIAIIAVIAVAVIISALAVIVHLRQSAIEVTEHGNETISQKVNEAVNAITKPNETNYEAKENPEQRASEGK